MDGGYSNSSCSCVHVAKKKLLDEAMTSEEHVAHITSHVFYGIANGQKDRFQKES